jgi:hypothetical protein
MTINAKILAAGIRIPLSLKILLLNIAFKYCNIEV